MPAKNSVKFYIENGYYHIYNRGVNKNKIFLDSQDYSIFISYLKLYLDPLTGSDPRSLTHEVNLLTYCLMPNHFHLLIKQITKNAMIKLMRSVSTRYSMYFNTKYKRVGPLFQGKYKAVLITNDIYLLHLSRYIHLNPGSDPRRYPYSSYSHYLGDKSISWIKSEEILNHFKTVRKISIKDCFSYQSFVEDYKKIDSFELLGNLTLE